MNLTTDCKILIDGYVDEVCVNLPRKKRADIAVEIRSLILDSLEARSQEFGEEPDEGMVIAILKELGAPLEMASAYQAHNYVIGPQMYAPFVMTVRGVLFFMGVFYVLAFLLSWGEATQSFNAFLETIWGLMVSFIEDALRNFSVIFVIFVILERVIPEQDWLLQLKAWGIVSTSPLLRGLFGRTTAGEWDFSKKDVSPKSEAVARNETIFGMVVILLVVIIFNFFPQKVGIFGVSNGDTWFVPVLAPTFDAYLPWWNIYWLLALILNFILLRQGHWTAFTRWFDINLMIFSGYIVLVMLFGSPVFGINPEYIDPTQLSADALDFAIEDLISVLTTIFKIVLTLHLIVKVPLIIYKIIKLRMQKQYALEETNGLNSASNQ